MSNDSIRLSEKYGLNPSIPICFFCGEEKGEIALLGKIGKKGEDIEAPMHMLLDYEPCDKCKEILKQGICIIGVSDKPVCEGQLAIQKGLYPIGKWCLMKEEAVSRIFSNMEGLDTVLEKKKLLVDDEVMDWLLSNNSKE